MVGANNMSNGDKGGLADGAVENCFIYDYDHDSDYDHEPHMQLGGTRKRMEMGGPSSALRTPHSAFSYEHALNYCKPKTSFMV